MAQNAAVDRNAGAAGWDWAYHQYDTVGAVDDLNINGNLVGLPLPVVVNRDRWQETEADSGSAFNDDIKGDDFTPSLQGGPAGIVGGFTGCDALDQAGLDRISGLDALVPPLTGDAQTDVGHVPGLKCPLSGPFWGAGNILIGGAGSDKLEGRGGDDLIDGDRYLTTRISVRTDPANSATEIGSTDMMEHNYLPGGGGPTLQAAVFAGTVDPGNLVAVREITTPASPNALDTAVFTGPLSNYACGATIPATLPCDATSLASSPLVVTQTGANVANQGVSDGSDTLTGIEKLQFLDTTLSIVPSGTLSPTSLTFGSQTINTTSATQTVTITNGGQQNLVLSNIAFAGTNAADFLRPAPAPAGACTNTTSLVTNASCTVAVTFRPGAGANGTRSGILRFTDNNNGVAASTQDVALTGTAISPQPLAGITPTTLTFAARNTATTSAAQTITLSNTGNAVLNIGGIATTGDFARSGGTCATTVAAGASCSIGVTFTPTAAGARAGTLVITDNSGNVTGSTQTATLSGTGIAVNGIANVTGSGAFGGQQVGIVSASRTFTMTNSGTGPLTIASVAVVASTEFVRPVGAAGGTCATTVNAGASCTVILTFTPNSAAAKTGTLRFTDNSGGTAGTIQDVALTGTGVNAAITPTATALAFGTNNTGALTGAGGVNRTVTIRNSGPAGSQLRILAGAVTISGGQANQFTVATNGCNNVTLAANATCNITVNFRATSGGNKTSTLRIVSNALTTPTNIGLQGTGNPTLL
jgi:hypothetical protein